jgi:signal transduction histidine kinase/HPt (histidine-containing phosphotransfer) domain-containing protein
MQENYLFASAEDEVATVNSDNTEKTEWKVLIVDDEPEVHTLTRLNLHNILFRGARLSFISAYSAAEAAEYLEGNSDIAVILLDVVMEEDSSGLKLVDDIRGIMENQRVRIILRTGQPGQAPEAEVVLKYDINDYRSKTDLTQERLVTSVIGALRNYADMLDLERSERHRHLVEEKAATRALFLASVSHEIRTPMHGIMGTLELLSNTQPNDDQQPLIKICQDSATYLLSIIDDILDFSKIDAGKLEIVHEMVNVADMVHGALDQLASRAWLKDIELVILIDPNTPSIVHCDPKRVQQILINLVGNAIKFTHMGHILVNVSYDKTTDNKPYLYFQVEDTGVGMNAEQQARLFTPFEQASLKTNRKYGGTGLGLAISQRLVQLMDGTIDAASKPGGGSTFRFSVNLASTPELQVKNTSLKAKKLMLLGDETVGTQAAQTMLESTGAEVFHVHDGTEATRQLLAAFDENRLFDAIIIDETVQHQHCIHWLRKIQNHDKLMTIPVAVTVRRSSQSLIARLRGIGIHQVVMKMIRADALETSITNLLDAKNTSGLMNKENDQETHDTKEISTWSRIRFPETKVLVADDSRVNQYVIRKMLEHLSISVRTVENGQDAIRALVDDIGVFHLAFIDCFMPDIEGYDVVRRVRESESNSNDHLPVIALSASYLPEDIQMSREAGMDDYITKPVDIATLAKTLHKWLPQECRRVEVGRGQELAMDNHSTLRTKVGKVSLFEEAEKAGVDLSKLTELYGDLNSKARVLVDMFMRDVPRFIVELEDAVSRKDRERVAYTSHSIAGSSGVVGAHQLAYVAQNIEYDIRNDKWENVEKDTPILSSKYERACQFFDTADWHQ